MVEAEFERRLSRLFDQAPELPGGAAFVRGVERRLRRRALVRRWLVGSAGLVGGLIGASQLMLSNVGDQVALAGRAADVLSDGLSRTAGADMASALSGGFGVWVALGLAVLTLGFALSRVIEEF